jgi:hypothetical protein
MIRVVTLIEKGLEQAKQFVAMKARKMTKR